MYEPILIGWEGLTCLFIGAGSLPAFVYFLSKTWLLFYEKWERSLVLEEKAHRQGRPEIQYVDKPSLFVRACICYYDWTNSPLPPIIHEKLWRAFGRSNE